MVFARSDVGVKLLFITNSYTFLFQRLTSFSIHILRSFFCSSYSFCSRLLFLIESLCHKNQHIHNISLNDSSTDCCGMGRSLYHRRYDSFLWSDLLRDLRFRRIAALGRTNGRNSDVRCSWATNCSWRCFWCSHRNNSHCIRNNNNNDSRSSWSNESMECFWRE